jgi:hypothetical protein
MAVFADSVHGDGTKGVNRSTAVCEEWPGEACVTGSCAHCHGTFDPATCGVNDAMLFFNPLDGAEGNDDFCMKCHRPSGSLQVQPPSMPAAATNIYTIFKGTPPFYYDAKDYQHFVLDYSGIHRFWYASPPAVSSEDVEDRTYLSLNKHVECNDCHNPHTAEAKLHTSNEVHVPAHGNDTSGSPINGAFGVEPTWSSSNWGGATNWPSTSSTATKEYQICFKCHSDYNTNPSGWNSANIDWIDTTNPSAWTDVALEFNPSNQSYHPVGEPLPAVDPGYNGSTDSYGSNRLPPAHTSLLIGDSGLKTGGAVGKVTDSSKSWATNEWQNWGVRFGSTDEAPAHSVLTHDYVRTIESNSPNQLTVAGYFPDASYLPDGVTVYSIEYYAGSGASRSGNTVTHSIKDFTLYVPSLVGYTVVIQDDPTNSNDTSVDWVATGVVLSNDVTSFTVDGWSVLVGSLPASGTVAYYFSSTGQAMMCSDCHGNDEISTTAAQGPHGSAVKWMLKGRNRAWPASSTASNGAGYDGTLLYSVHYTYMGRYAPRYENDGTADGLFCLNCHSTVSFSKDGNGLQALGSPTENIHLEHNAPCIQCHVMIPHGSKNSRLIADQDDDSSRYAYNNNCDNMGVTEFVIKAFGPEGRAAPDGYPTGSHGSSLYCSKNCHDVPVEAPW